MKRAPPSRSSTFRNHHSHLSLYKTSWDNMGPLPLAPCRDHYILVVTDLFTKWMEAFPLVDTTANTLATILMNDYYLLLWSSCISP